MGLDMYLEGERFFFKERKTRKGKPVKSETVELGYWRKHPNLHGFIVQQFADGVDDCKKIELSEEDLIRILEATKSDSLPHTEGFFFGESQPEDKERTITIIEEAISWLREERLEDGVIPTIYYQASW